MRENWQTKAEEKEAAYKRLMRIIESEESEDRDAIASIRTMIQADFRQWEIDHPELAGKIKGDGKSPVVIVNIEQTMKAVEEIEKRLGRQIGLPPAMRQIEDAAQVLPEELSKAE